MIRTAPAKTSAEMNKAQAKAITDRIRRDIDSAWVNITTAYEGKAWKALGYGSWEAYVKAEFDMGRSRSYQLLDQGRVIHALAEATGKLSTTVDISERDARDLKADLPAVTAEIKARVSAGEKPEQAAADVVAAKRAEKDAEREKQRQEKAAAQAKNDAFRDQNRAALPDHVKAREQAKAARKAEPAITDLERIAELEEAVRSLEVENASLKARIKLFAEMEAEWKTGGFAEVIAGKEEVIAAQASRIERESVDKASWKRSADMWRKRAEEAGWSSDVVIDINPAEVAHG